MVISLKTRFTLAITLVSMVSILVISLIVNFSLEKQFRTYAMRKQEARNQEIASLVSKQYFGDGLWQTRVIENIGVSVLEESLILQVTDSTGQTVWDALQYNSGICHAMIDQMAQRMLIKYPALNGGLSHKDYPVMYAGRAAGNVRIGYYGPFYYTDAEFFFIDTINKMLVLVALFSLVLSLVSGFILSFTISAPITAVTRLAGNIARGEYQSIDHIRSHTKEVRELIRTINHMSAAVSSQEKLRKRLTADVAHELRTPLTTLRGAIEAMIDGIWDTSQKQLESCRVEILRIINLVSGMETLSRLDADAIILNKTDFDLKALAEMIISHHAGLYTAKQITVSCTGENITIRADKERTSQVILNLFSNACQFTQEQGAIAVTVKRSSSRTVFAITDNGTGIPAADLPHVFERFYRVDQARTHSSGGSGIGLTIAREIARAHNWEIKISSAPGQGTTVELWM